MGDTTTKTELSFRQATSSDGPFAADVETDIQLEGVVPPEIMARTVPEYARAWVIRLRSGDTGLLPVIVGLILISIIFQSLNSRYGSPTDEITRREALRAGVAAGAALLLATALTIALPCAGRATASGRASTGMATAPRSLR